jgi:YD repeat-containing protein
VFISDSSLAYVTFDLTGLPLGTYSVRVRDGARTATLTNGVNVITGKPGSVEARLATPKAMRPDWTETVTVDYVNVGDTDVPAPLMMLTAENGALALPSPSVVKSSRVQLLGIHTEGPAGVLPPGARGSITLEVTPTSGSGQITYDLGVLSDPNLQMSWDDVKDDMRPDFVPADAWDAIYANFLAEVGTSAGQFQRVLADNATYLSRLGVYTYDVQQLTMFEITQAGVSEITERYSLGPFGRGLTPWWAIAAVTDGQGNVSLQAGSLWRLFRKQADGSFRGVPGDFGTLTLAAGLYSLRELDGTIIAFRSGGTLDYLEDPNGNQVTAAYSGSQITGLVASNGDTVSYTYDARGRIVQAVDAVGRTTTYTYDSSGEHLVTATNPQGTMTLARVTGQGLAREHALQSLTFPDGTHRFYEYDDRGRLVRASGDGGAEATSYAYDSAAGVTITDANGSTTTLRFNQLGQPAHITDGLSNSTAFAYDEQNLLSRIAAPAGNTASLRYDDAGNLTRLVDPMGAQIRFGYEPMFNQLTALTNATGHTIEYQIDAHANPTSVAYPNGDKEASEYDSVGDLIAWTNARGHIIHNTYDTHDLLTRQDLPDGSHRQFTYDTHRNLTAASDARGTTSLVYDNADRLTKITYPSGRFLQFTYDAGGRRTRSTDQGGFAVNYAYDAVGRLSSLTDGSGAPIVSYTYDAAGQLTRKDLGNGTYTTYEYDLN